MDDFERYSDYNDIEDDEEKASGFSFGKFLLILAGILIGSVVLLLIARVALFDHYPKEIRSVMQTPAFVSAYRTEGENLKVYKQNIRFPYDDCDLESNNSNDLGTFFADYVTVIPAAGELQVALRFNTSAYEKLAPVFKIDSMTDADLDKLTFTLEDEKGNLYPATEKIKDDLLLYRYFRVAFGGIDFDGLSDGVSSPTWLRVMIGYEGCETIYSYLLVYENNEAFHTFSEYKLGKGEIPQ